MGRRGSEGRKTREAIDPRGSQEVSCSKSRKEGESPRRRFRRSPCSGLTQPRLSPDDGCEWPAPLAAVDGDLMASSSRINCACRSPQFSSSECTVKVRRIVLLHAACPLCHLCSSRNPNSSLSAAFHPLRAPIASIPSRSPRLEPYLVHHDSPGVFRAI